MERPRNVWNTNCQWVKARLVGRDGILPYSSAASKLESRHNLPLCADYYTARDTRGKEILAKIYERSDRQQ